MTKADARVILVSGRMVADPRQAGAAWAALQYVLGMRRLGHQVYFVEPIESQAVSSQQAALFNSTVDRFELRDKAGLIDSTGRVSGLSASQFAEIARRADVLINLSGVLKHRDLLQSIPVRIYVDLDPAFTQLWHVHQGVDMGFDSHTHFATVGSAIGTEACEIPTLNRQWFRIPPPVVLEHWPVVTPQKNAPFTSIGNWRSYGSIRVGETHYGQRAHSFRELAKLPRLTSHKIEMALAIHPDESSDLQLLEDNGWNCIDPMQVASTLDGYRRFIQQSKAELCIAKQGYVVSHSGWLSDRSACYLASGRPVLAQDTGFGQFIPAHRGLLAFQTAEEAADQIEAISRDYEYHCRAARELAEEYFDSDRVLTTLLRHGGIL